MTIFLSAQNRQFLGWKNRRFGRGRRFSNALTVRTPIDSNFIVVGNYYHRSLSSEEFRKMGVRGGVRPHAHPFSGFPLPDVIVTVAEHAA